MGIELVPAVRYLNAMIPSRVARTGSRAGAFCAVCKRGSVAALRGLLCLLVVMSAGAIGPGSHAAESEVANRDITEKRTTHPLVWDTMEKTLDAKPGDGAAEFVFAVQNRSDVPIHIMELRPSCGCTVAEPPENPWILAPGAKGEFRATLDFRGKHGRFAKGIHVVSSAGTQLLTATVNIPEADDAERELNRQLAAADRQAIFRGKCAACHAEPAAGKTGAPLFMAACAVCHISERRAGMVPDLLVAREPRDAAYWRKWISEGREQTLMPAFSTKHGGPLSDDQIESLVSYLLENLPTRPPGAKP